MPKSTQEYLASRGLRNALYTVRAADLKDDLFGKLVLCPLQVRFKVFRFSAGSILFLVLSRCKVVLFRDYDFMLCHILGSNRRWNICYG